MVLYRPPAGAGATIADAVEAVLRDASAAYRAASTDNAPFALDGDRQTGTDAFLAWAEAYADEVLRWRAFSGDYCLMDADGRIC